MFTTSTISDLTLAPAPSVPAVRPAGSVPSVYSVPSSSLSAPAQGRAAERLEFCRQVYNLASTGATDAVAVAAVATRTELFPILAHAGKHGDSALTLHNYRRWIRSLRADNGQPDFSAQHALADRYGQVRARAGDDRFWKLVAGYYLNENRLSLAQSYTMALRTSVTVQPPIHPEMIPSLNQVSYWFSTKADTAAVMAARFGAEFAKNRIAGYIMRDWSAVRVGEVWVGDHHQFDCPCRVWDEAKGDWIACRPWLTAWLDAKSDYFVGWLIRAGEHPDSLAIEDAFLNGIHAADNRPPAIIVIDNGKDYASAGFYAPVVLDGSTEISICGELNVRHVTALPYNARAKTIERQFGRVAAEFAKWWPGYRGSCPQNRPDRATDVWNNPGSLPSLQQLCEAFAFYLREFYHASANGSSITGGKPPAELWQARDRSRRAFTEAELFGAFLKPCAHSRKVLRGGAVRFAGAWYAAEDLWPHFNHDIMLKIDRADAEHVFAFEPNGRLICECRKLGLTAALASTDDERAQVAEGMRKQRRQLARTRALVQEYTGEVRVAMPVDRLQLTSAEPLEGERPREPLPFPADSAVLTTSRNGTPKTDTKDKTAESAPSNPERVQELERLLALDTQELSVPGATASPEDLALLEKMQEENWRND